MSTFFRIKCPACGNVCNVPENGSCTKCNVPVQTSGEGMIQLYRMGSPIGVAVGYGIYINGIPYGHIGNKETFRIPLSYGTYTLHFTCGMTRKCEDLTVVLSPENPYAYVKAHIKPGFWTNKLIAENSTPEAMPPL